MRPIAALHELTVQQRAFVDAFIEHGDARRAAKEAGYTGTTLRIADRQLLSTPHVAFAISLAARRRLLSATPMALNTLEYLAERAQSEKVRLDASKAILDRAGLVAPTPPKAESNEIEKPLHELSLDALRAKVAQMESEIADRARDVSPAKTDDKSADVIDLLG